MIKPLNQGLIDLHCHFMTQMDGELSGSKKEVIKDCMFEWPIKNILSPGFLNGFSGFIALISLIFCHFINIKDVFEDC